MPSAPAAASVGGPTEGPMVIGNVTVDISYTNASDQWLGTPTQYACTLFETNCPVVFENASQTGSTGIVVVFLWSTNNSIVQHQDVHEFNVTRLGSPFSLPFGVAVPAIADGIGWARVALAVEGPGFGGPYA